jgi:phosphonate transport system permease protein
MKIEESIKVWGQRSSDEIAGEWGMGTQLYRWDTHTGNTVDISVSRPLDRATFTVRMFLAVLALLTIYALATIDYRSADLAKAVPETLHNFKIIFFHSAATRLSLWDAFYEVVITMGLAFLTTVFSGLIALVLGLFASRNLAPREVTNIIKGFVTLIRAVPTILWVLIFAAAAGLGSVAAVIGLTFHSISYLTKAYSESFEELDRSVIEALMASGANWWQIVFQAVIPSTATYLLSWTFLRFEINFANAVAMGAAAGAGGIGFDLFMDSGFYFDLREIGLITYILIAFAIVLETVSTKLKGKIPQKA